MTQPAKAAPVPRRGEVWWVTLDSGENAGKPRLCAVLSRDVVNEHRHTVVVVPVWSSPSALPPIRVPVMVVGRPSVAAVDQIRPVAKERLKSRLGMLSAMELEAIGNALRQILEIG
jgi:mRNA interferase MazF